MDTMIMTEAQLAKVLGLSLPTLRRRVKEGKVPAPLIDGQHVNRRWSCAVIEKWLAGEKVEVKA